jgi:dTMP kinase
MPEATRRESRGFFVTFEGGEGVGKSTQVARLAERLRRGGVGEVVTTREPGGTPRAERIRAALLGGAAKAHGPLAEALLFAAARLDHLDALIRPALARGAVVLCDRFSDSTRAYQGAAGGVEPRFLDAVERAVVGATRPDLTLVLDLAPAEGLARAEARAGARDRFEAESAAFHERLRQAFRAIAAADPARCVLVDAGRPPDAVEADIWAAVARRLPAAIRDDAA